MNVAFLCLFSSGSFFPFAPAIWGLFFFSLSLFFLQAVWKRRSIHTLIVRALERGEGWGDAEREKEQKGGGHKRRTLDKSKMALFWKHSALHCVQKPLLHTIYVVHLHGEQGHILGFECDVVQIELYYKSQHDINATA